MGPRQPPDKRHAAYEAIFQRPGAAHHVPSPTFSPIPPQPHHPGYQFPPQQYQPPDRRTSMGSYNSAYSHNGYPQQPPPGTYRQSYYAPPPHFPPHIPPGAFDQQPPAPYGYPPPNMPRARSIISNTHSPGIITPQPDESPELSPQGLTPAQAYQAQARVYMNNTSPPQPEWNRYRTSPNSADRNSLSPPQNGGPNRNLDPPRLGINLEPDDGRLGIDFAGSSGTSSDDASELPWAKKEQTGPCLLYLLSPLTRTDYLLASSSRQAEIFPSASEQQRCIST